jgi:hypothetical protein
VLARSWKKKGRRTAGKTADFAATDGAVQAGGHAQSSRDKKSGGT